ncbi:MAG: hypothetical protein JRN15_14620, partial [Nitrososphaerota archaeon]|nr:hypothetical protein [Nitrososphaerota archaeon]
SSNTESVEEAEQVIRELEKFLEWSSRSPMASKNIAGSSSWSVSILTFYKAQERLLRLKLRTLFRSTNLRTFTDGKRNVKVTLGTVDRFQGREADLVILSFVRNHRSGMGFLDCPNRLNVALTRAKYQLVMVGDRFFFSHQKRSELLKNLVVPQSHEIYFGGDNRR